jgi:hypothetical protein
VKAVDWDWFNGTRRHPLRTILLGLGVVAGVGYTAFGYLLVTLILASL